MAATTFAGNSHRAFALTGSREGANQASGSTVQKLLLNEPVRRAIKGPEVHDYQVTLTAGQYLHVVINQETVDLVFLIIDPGGKPIGESDWTPKRMQEDVWALGEKAGDYRLQVYCTDKQEAGGEYGITLERVGSWQQAPSEDRNWVTAQRLRWEADPLYTQGTGAALKQALEKFREEELVWNKVNAVVRQASALNFVALCHVKMGRPQESLPYYQRAILLYREAGNRRDEIDVTINTGVAYARANEHRKGLEYLKQAVELIPTWGDKKRDGVVHNAIGSLHIALAEYAPAIIALTRSVQTFQDIGDQRWEAYALNNLGLCYTKVGETQKALDAFDRALPFLRAAKDIRGEAYTLYQMASLFGKLGELEKDLEYHKQALSLRRSIGAPDLIGTSLSSIATTYRLLGDPQKALETHTEALPLVRAAKDIPLEAFVLAGLGAAHRSLGSLKEALEYINQAIVLARTVEDRHNEAYYLADLADCYVAANDMSNAERYYREALQISSAIGNRWLEAILYHYLANMAQTGGRLDDARNLIEKAVRITESLRADIITGDLRLSHFARRKEHYELYVDILMQLYKRENKDAYAAEAFWVNERGRARGLLDSLREAGANVRAGAPSELLERESALRQKINTSSETYMKLVAGKHDKDQATAMAKEIETLTSGYEQLLAQIKESSPKYAALTQALPLKLQEIQTQVLDSDTALLEYALGEKRSYLWAITSTSFKVFELPGRAKIEDLARRAHDLMTARRQQVKFERPEKRKQRIADADAEYLQVAGALSRLVLEPAAQYLNKSRLIVVSDGALQYVPFAALPLSGRLAQGLRPPSYTPLIERYEVVSLPSASTLGVLRRELAGRKPAPKQIAVLADPVFSLDDERLQAPEPVTRGAASPRRRAGEDVPGQSPVVRAATDVEIFGEGGTKIPRLPFSRREADAIIRVVPAGESKKAVGFDASEETATDPGLSQYRVVHFATHGFVNAKHPALSGLVLSLFDENGNSKDGFLMAHEVYNLNLPAELVVLSGCRTGLGKEVKGEGLMALTRGFMYAGAARVVVSLWDVDDQSTAELMTRFYRAIYGKQRLSPAAALRKAQTSMAKDRQWNAPYYWAGFVLQGEPK